MRYRRRSYGRGRRRRKVRAKRRAPRFYRRRVGRRM